MTGDNKVGTKLLSNSQIKFFTTNNYSTSAKTVAGGTKLTKKASTTTGTGALTDKKFVFKGKSITFNDDNIHIVKTDGNDLTIVKVTGITNGAKTAGLLFYNTVDNKLMMYAAKVTDGNGDSTIDNLTLGEFNNL